LQLQRRSIQRFAVLQYIFSNILQRNAETLVRNYFIRGAALKKSFKKTRREIEKLNLRNYGRLNK
jgi:hypothetical protein